VNNKKHVFQGSERPRWDLQLPCPYKIVTWFKENKIITQYKETKLI